MASVVLQEIISRLEGLDVNELQELNQVIQQYLTEQEESCKKAAFHQALLSSGLVKQIKRPIYRQTTQEQLIYLEGKPLSETILEERR